MKYFPFGSFIVLGFIIDLCSILSGCTLREMQVKVLLSIGARVCMCVYIWRVSISACERRSTCVISSMWRSEGSLEYWSWFYFVWDKVSVLLMLLVSTNSRLPDPLPSEDALLSAASYVTAGASGLQTCGPCPALYEFWEISLRSHDCTANALTLRPLPWSQGIAYSPAPFIGHFDPAFSFHRTIIIEKKTTNLGKGEFEVFKGTREVCVGMV